MTRILGRRTLPGPCRGKKQVILLGDPARRRRKNAGLPAPSPEARRTPASRALQPFQESNPRLVNLYFSSQSTIMAPS
jgi:hypothetical protein